MKKEVICILGMHRSGTSCLAGSLQYAGLYLGNVHVENKFNLKGNREHILINKLQEDVLVENEGSWFRPPGTIIWSKTNYVKLCGIVSEFNSYPRWGFKDPRSVFTLPVLEKCIGSVCCVGSFRNPFSVANSLQRRNPNIGDQSFWMDLWNKYNMRLIEIWEERRFPIINFDKKDTEYLEDLNKIYDVLGLEGGDKDSRSLFFDTSMRAEVSEEAEGLPGNILATYRRLQEISI